MLEGPADEPPVHRVVALDVGGTSLKGLLVDEQLRPVLSRRWPTPRRAGPDAVIARIGTALSELLDEVGSGVPAGVVVPGLVDEERGMAVHSVNLGWRDVPLRDRLTERLGVPIAFGHDVRAGGLAEATVGAARDARHALFVAIGTGVAGAVIIDGSPYRGDGFAGELGHVVVSPSGPPCRCGQSGCLEAIASAAAIERRYAERGGDASPTAAEVSRLALAGDRLARDVWQEAIDALATGLAACATVLAPQRIVLGGGLSRAGQLLFEPLRTTLRRRLSFRTPPDVVPAALGDEAACIGAALMARELAGHDRGVNTVDLGGTADGVGLAP